MSIDIIVACRLKSTRMPRKALLPIYGRSSIDRCLDHCLQFKKVDSVVLGTSWVLDDRDLFNKFFEHREIKTFLGHPENLIARYTSICNAWFSTHCVRLSGDCPVVSPEIGDILIDSHLETDADYTEAVSFAVGTTCQIIKAEALRKLNRLVPNPEYSEHLGLYFANNPDIFKINRVELPPHLVRNYRLTLDWPEDLEMFNRLYEKLNQLNLSDKLFNIFYILDRYPEIPAINQHLVNVYEEPEFREELNEGTRIK